MKKLLIILGVFFVILITSIIVIPIIFKDDIQKALDEAMAENLNASVYYDLDAFNVSLIKNFPDLTVSIGDFGIVGVEIFEEDTLTSVKNFQVTVDLMSAISGDQIIVEEIRLDDPKIMIMVLPDGTANYDIAVASEEDIAPAESETDEADTTSSNLSVGIKKWSINNASLVYVDQSLDFYTTLMGLTHEGSGDFTLDVFDLTTNTKVEAASLGFEGVEYVSDKRLNLDVTLNMNLSEMRFTFMENRIAVNDFAMEADGYVAMPGEDINMDISFGGKDISIKSILSLIPGVYQEYLDGVTANGNIAFDGYVKGIFNETSMPQVAASLGVSDGSIRYSKFDIPIEALNIQTSFDYPSADLSETSFNIDKFSMLVDGESVSAYLKFKNLVNYQWDFGFDGNADLEKITSIVPLEGMDLVGKINATLNTKGQMSDVEAAEYDKLPTSGSMTIKGFQFVSEEYLPQGFNVSDANLSFNPAAIALETFNSSSGNSDFQMDGKLTNYLGFALSDEMLKGELNLNSSLIDINELLPASEDSSEESDEADNEAVPADTASVEVIKIPENIDFTLATSIKKIAYSNMPITNFKGKVIIRDGAIRLNENSFNLLEGTFKLSGSYETKDLDQPKYDLGFEVKDLSISSAFQTFETVKKYVPIAEHVSGTFNTDFSVSGLLGQDMMPIMDAINMQGLVNIAKASLDRGAFIQKLSSVASLKTGLNASSKTQQISLKDVLIKTQIKDGRMFIEPFDLKVNGQEAVLGGSNTLDGKLDYSMLLKDVPTGQIGSALNSAISSFTGGKKIIADKIDLNLGIGGTYDDPSVKLLGTSNSQGSGGSSSLEAGLKDKLEEQKANAKAEAEAELAKQKAAAEAKAKAAADSAKAVLKAQKKATEDSVKAAIEAKKKAAEEAAKKKVKSLFKKKGDKR